MAAHEQTGQTPIPPAEPLMPVGAWIRLEWSGNSVVGFTYVDKQAGFSAQGWKLDGNALDQSARMIIRLPMPGVPWRRLEPGEIRAWGLEPTPSWVAEFYGPQPLAGSLWGVWREHPKLKGRFLPDYPDDIQVFVHDGGPASAATPPRRCGSRPPAWTATCSAGGF